MRHLRITVRNQVGLHARPAAEFVKLTSRFSSNVCIRNRTRDSTWVDAKSILSVLTLGVESGHEIELRAEGEDEEEAVRALRELIKSNFGEKDRGSTRKTGGQGGEQATTAQREQNEG